MNTRIAALLFSVLALAACGADEEPIKPTANVNVGVSNSGVQTGASVGLKKGPFNINIGGVF